MKYLDKYPNCIGCPVKKWCGTMIGPVELCNSYQDNKEETKIDYKKRYNQAIEAAKKELNCCGSLDCDAARQIFRLFPELREPENERIRNLLISLVENWKVYNPNSPFTDYPIYESNKEICDKILAWLEKQGEKSWSEEDDDNIKRICSYLELYLNHAADINEIEECKYLKDWLKSLKPQPHWKPSEEQMEALFEAKLASIKNREYFLGLLYEDLKKL